jgi:mycothiol synthase
MRIRSLVEADMPAVTALLARRLEADGRPALSEHKAIRVGRSVAGRPGSSEPGPSGWGTVERVLLDPDIVGYGHAAHHPPPAPGEPGRHAVEVAVAPGVDEVRRAALIMEALLAAAPPGTVGTVWGWRPDDLAAASTLGLVPLRSLHEMARSLPLSRTSPVLPEGVTIRPFRPGVDEDAWLEVNNAAFAGHPENGALDRANLEAREALPWFDPDGFFMAWEEERLLGFCWTKRHDDGRGEIYIVGVAPAAQGRGLGSVLVIAALDDLAHRQGVTEAVLSVDGANSGAIAFYEMLGFSVVMTVTELGSPT